MVYRLQAFVAGILKYIIQVLPFSVTRRLARAIGDILYLCLKTRRDIAIRNLTRAFGDTLSPEEKRDIARSSFQNVALSITELFLIDKMRKEASERFRFHGLHLWEDALKRGKGVILVISHIGSWEYMSFLYYLNKHRASVIVKEIRNPYINKWVDEARRKLLLTPILKKDSIRAVLGTLRRKETVAILIDQWSGPQGIWQDFFGERTSTTSVPYRLAVRTGSPLVPAFCLRRDDGTYDIEIEPPLLLEERGGMGEAETTRHLNRVLEEKIRQYPHQWIWTHRRWKPKPASVRLET